MHAKVRPFLLYAKTLVSILILENIFNTIFMEPLAAQTKNPLSPISFNDFILPRCKTCLYQCLQCLALDLYTCGSSEVVASLSGSPTLLSTVAVSALEVGDLLLPALFFPLLTFLDDIVDFRCLVVLSSALLALSLAFF